MRRSRERSQELERVEGEIVDVEPVVARPVARSRRPGAVGPHAPPERPVVVYHHVVSQEQPVAPVVPGIPERRRPPLWLVLVAYVVAIAFAIFAALSVAQGPPWSHPSERPSTHQGR